VHSTNARPQRSTPRATGNFGYLTRPRATGALREPLKRAVDHLVELARILEAADRPAEAQAARRIAAELAAVR
jgi:hypothetical protein